ncbi:MAG: helix-turn-helix domain-containing protein [Ramlibacter sp.]|nr:helix-turn-helix domain-containing protein [Ramlibacter sp.]
METTLSASPPSLLRGQRPQLLAVQAPALDLRAGPDPTGGRPFKLLWQVRGRLDVQQQGRLARLDAGQFTLLDGAQAFHLRAGAPGAQLVVALPRQRVLDRHAGIHRQTARVQGSGPDEALLADFLQALAARSGALSDTAVAHAAGAVLALLGGLAQRAPQDARAQLRARALALLELDIASASAASLAAHLRVSRRHLDGAFASTGKTLGQHLWDRRLALAAEQLRDAPRRPVTQIAHGLGFKDSSHFSRMFRQRFGLPPSRWRSLP